MTAHTSRCAALAATLAVATPAQTICPPPAKPAVCAALVPGTPLPFDNPAAPAMLDLGGATVIEIYILGHSENRGYGPLLQAMLDQAPPLPGIAFQVQSHWISGHEAWRWATPGQRGYATITNLLANRQHPAIALGLFSNNQSFPIQTPNASDPHYVKFVDDLEAVADRLADGGNGVLMTYFSAHRYKPTNFLPSYYESCAVGALVARAGSSGKAYLEAGPEQHDLHWCCFPGCYAPDLEHTNRHGERLMAETWYAFLTRELTGCATVPFGEGTAGTGGATPVLAPTGGFPRSGNALYALQASELLPAAPIAYVLGSNKRPSPLLVQPVVVVSALASAAGEHTLPLPIPATAALHGAVVLAQALALDPGASLSLAATQGLELHFCR